MTGVKPQVEEALEAELLKRAQKDLRHVAVTMVHEGPGVIINEPLKSRYDQILHGYVDRNSILGSEEVTPASAAFNRVRYALRHFDDLGPETLVRSLGDLWREGGGTCVRKDIAEETIVNQMMIGTPGQHKLEAAKLLSTTCGTLTPAGGRLFLHGVGELAEWLQDRPGDVKKVEGVYTPEGIVLSGQDYSGQDLRNARLAGANLRAISLEGADLSGADLSDAALSSCECARSSFVDTDFTRAILDGANFEGADLTGSVFRSSKMSSAEFSGAKLVGVSIQHATAEGADFNRANLSYSHLDNTDMSGTHCSVADLSNATIKDINWRNADLTRANFEGSRLTQVDFSLAHLQGANFQRAVLVGCSFNAANLFQTDFTGATITDCDFTRAERQVEGGDMPGWRVAGSASYSNVFGHMERSRALGF